MNITQTTADDLTVGDYLINLGYVREITVSGINVVVRTSADEITYNYKMPLYVSRLTTVRN